MMFINHRNVEVKREWGRGRAVDRGEKDKIEEQDEWEREEVGRKEK